MKYCFPNFQQGTHQDSPDNPEGRLQPLCVPLEMLLCWKPWHGNDSATQDVFPWILGFVRRPSLLCSGRTLGRAQGTICIIWDGTQVGRMQVKCSTLYILSPALAWILMCQWKVLWWALTSFVRNIKFSHCIKLGLNRGKDTELVLEHHMLETTRNEQLLKSQCFIAWINFKMSFNLNPLKEHI